LHVGDGMDRSLFSFKFSLSPSITSLFSFQISPLSRSSSSDSVPHLSGVAFLKEAPAGTYDAIIVDSSDPIGKFYSFL